MADISMHLFSKLSLKVDVGVLLFEYKDNSDFAFALLCNTLQWEYVKSFKDVFENS